MRAVFPVPLRVPSNYRCMAHSVPSDQLTCLRQGSGGFRHDRPALLHIAYSGSYSGTFATRDIPHSCI
jgi:hypothetical protein